MIVDPVYEAFESVQTQWLGLLERLSKGGHNMTLPRSTLRGLSTLGLDQRIKATFELALSIRPTNDDDLAAMLLHARSAELHNLCEQLNSVIFQALSELTSIWHPATRLLDNGDTYLLIMERDGAPVIEIDLTEYFRQIGDLSASLLAVVGQVVPLCLANGISDFGPRSNALAKRLNEVASLAVRAETILAQSEAANQRLMQLQADTTEINARSTDSLRRISDFVSQASAESGQVTALTEQIRTVVATAETLNQVVVGYQPKFEAFQKELGQRNEEFIAFTVKCVEANEASQKREATIDALIAQSNDMLAGATTAGLGVVLERARERYEKRMKRTQNGFYVAVSILMVSAVPLAAHLVPNLFGGIIPALDPKVDGSPFSVIGKVLLLLPATWLTAFFTQSYANLFQLEREYAHKAALAGSVHGFKLQAPKYEEEITAEVFMEIRTNPAHGPSVQAASHPLYDVLAKVVRRVLDKTKEKTDADEPNR